MRKKLLSILLVGGMIGLTACSGGTTSVDSKAKSEVESALSKLENYEDIYLVSTLLDSPEGDISYVEVNTSSGSYTEYPVTDTGEVGKASDSEDEDTTKNSETAYMLSDWLCNDGNFYLVGSEDNSGDSSKEATSTFYKLPKSYVELCKNRDSMYVRTMLSKFTSIEFYKETTADIGNGDETLKLYRCKLPSKEVQNILGVGSKGLYESLKSDYSDNKNLVKLCDYYLDELDMNLTFSDAIVTLGVSDDMLKYMSLETGGLGTRLYLTKSVIMGSISPRQEPDFSEAKDYTTTLQEKADYISEFDSYDEILEALSNKETNVKED